MFDSVKSVKLDLNTQRIYSGSTDVSVKVWDIGTMLNIASLWGHLWHVNDVDICENKVWRV